MKARIMIEVERTRVKETLENLKKAGFNYDAQYGQISFRGKDKDSVLIRGTVDEDKIPDLRKVADVREVWSDPKIEPFGPPHGHGL